MSAEWLWLVWLMFKIIPSFCSIFWILKLLRSRYHHNWSLYPKKFLCLCLLFSINLLKRCCVFLICLAHLFLWTSLLSDCMMLGSGFSNPWHSRKKNWESPPYYMQMPTFCSKYWFDACIVDIQTSIYLLFSALIWKYSIMVELKPRS